MKEDLLRLKLVETQRLEQHGQRFAAAVPHAGHDRVGIEFKPVRDRRNQFGDLAIACEADDLRGAEDRLKGALGGPSRRGGRVRDGHSHGDIGDHPEPGRTVEIEKLPDVETAPPLGRRPPGRFDGRRHGSGFFLRRRRAHGGAVVEIAGHLRIAGQPQRPLDVVAEVGPARDETMMLDIGCRDDGEQVERIEHRRPANDGCGHLEDIPRQRPDDRRRRVGADREALGDSRPHFDGNLRQKMDCQFLVATDLVLVVREILNEQLRRGAEQRRVARLLLRLGNVGKIVGELSRLHARACEQGVFRPPFWAEVVSGLLTLIVAN